MTPYRYPHITATTDKEQLLQLKNYLYGLVEQLNSAAASAEGVTLDAPQIKQQTPDPTDTFAALKGLIIKSADIVTAYTDKIEKKLSGVYVGRSDYGDFIRKTQSAITANAQAIEQNYTDLQQLVTDLQTAQQETRGYIRTGLLHYAGEEDPLPAGTPVYGVEVGQQNDRDFVRYGRFTAYGMTFYDENGNPAATVTQGRLQIPHARVALSFTEGGFADEVLPDGSIVTRWQGV